MRPHLQVLLVAQLALGCATIRTSSASRIADDEATLQLATTLEELEPRVRELFQERGFPLVDRRVTQTRLRLKFKGSRSSVTTISGSRSFVYGASTQIGSAFYVYLERGDGSVYLSVFGKPTLNGAEPCTDNGPDVDECEELSAGALWPGLGQVTGREEAETIRSVLLEAQPHLR